MGSNPLYSGILVVLLCFSAKAGALKVRGCPTGTGNYTYANFVLPLPSDGYLPAIDNETMVLHSVRHAGGAVANLNAILARYPSLQHVPLAELVRSIGSPTFNRDHGILANDSQALRNNAGSAYNHGIFWRIMTTYNTSSPSVLKPALSALINDTFGSPAGMLSRLQSAGASVFGSGWAWLVLQSNQTLAIVTTPNQDNPLMRQWVRSPTRGYPIIGVDVWEHAYYLSYRNVRANYLKQWVYLLDWSVLQRNYDLVAKGFLDSLYC